MELDRLREIVGFVKTHNPYPATVFIEPTDEQFDTFNECLKRVGLAPDAYNGSMGRKTWENCYARILETIEEEARDE